jgi:putative flavoprotein involved in K+ transport
MREEVVPFGQPLAGLPVDLLRGYAREVISKPVVVGAGPAGLAVAAELARQGRPCDVLEQAGSVGASWQGRYDSLRLHTVRWLSGLPGVPIPRRYGRWVARDDLVTYLSDYAEQFGVRPEFGVQVRRIERAGSGWRLQTSDGDREAPTVVVATGYSRVPHVPDWPGRDSFTGTITHSADYREPSPYRGRQVLVVGAGNSAAEIALDLAGVAARVDLSVRTPPNIVRRDTFGVPSQLLGVGLKHVPERVMNPLTSVLRKVSVPDLSPQGLPRPTGDGFTQFLRTRTVPILDHGFVDAVRSGRIRVVANVDRLNGADVRLADGSTLTPDAVLCATGYRTGLEPIVGHLGVLDERGLPRIHGPATLPDLPGLYFVGITIQLAGLLREIGLEARAVGRAIAS